MMAKPVVVAYDISNDKIRVRVMKILRDWRLGGQLSVHECLLENDQAEELFLQIAEQLDHSRDKLLLAWLEPHRPVISQGIGQSVVRDTLRHIR